jgi:hypothetical protein
MTNNLNSLGVHEMNAQEIREIEGGFVIITAICFFALGMAIGASLFAGKNY